MPYASREPQALTSIEAMNRQTRSLIIRLRTHIMFQTDRTRGDKDWAQTVSVPEQREFAEFIDPTVPFEGRQLVIVVVCKVGAVDGRGIGTVGSGPQAATTIAKHHVAQEIVLAVASECPSGHGGGSGDEEKHVGRELHFDFDVGPGLSCYVT